MNIDAVKDFRYALPAWRVNTQRKECCIGLLEQYFASTELKFHNMTHDHVLQSPPWSDLSFPTLVSHNCKQAKLLLEKYDAGQEKKPQTKQKLSGSHRCTWCVRITTEMRQARFGK